MSHAHEDKPNAFIIGAPRSGTTSLFHYLGSHPEVCTSELKEPCYFCSHDPWIQKARGPVVEREEEYLDLFPDKSKAVVLEATTDYLWVQGTGERLASFNPDAKIILLLRDPIERAHSHYFLYKRNGKEPLSFSEAVKAERPKRRDYILPGKYWTHYVRWSDIFPKDQLHVVASSNFFLNTEESLEEICRFLQIDSDVDQMNVDKVHRRTKNPKNEFTRWILTNEFIQDTVRSLLPGSLVDILRNKFIVDTYERPDIEEEEEEYLRTIFESEIRKLEEELEDDIDGWFPNFTSEVPPSSNESRREER